MANGCYEERNTRKLGVALVALIGLVIGLRSSATPVPFVVWALTVPVFIAVRQKSKHGLLVAVVFAITACAPTVVRLAQGTWIDAVRFASVVWLAAPAAFALGLVGYLPELLRRQSAGDIVDGFMTPWASGTEEARPALQ